MKISRAILAIGLLVVVTYGTASVAAQAPPRYDEFYVFGDSLVDNGNDEILSSALGVQPAIPPSTSPHNTYFRGRFSNGPVAPEYLWALLTQTPVGGLTPALALRRFVPKPAVDFAFGGSDTNLISQTGGGFFVPGLMGQVDLFRMVAAGRRPSPRALYLIVTGSNDYLVQPPASPADPAAVVSRIGRAVTELYRLGARNVVVVNLPDLGLVPLVAGSPQQSALSALTVVHNALLAQALQGLAARFPALKLFPFDLIGAFQQLPPGMIPTPALDALVPVPFGTTPTSLCLFTTPAACPDAPTFTVDPRYLFWDAEHPTTTLHYVMAQLLLATVQQ